MWILGRKFHFRKCWTQTFDQQEDGRKACGEYALAQASTLHLFSPWKHGLRNGRLEGKTKGLYRDGCLFV